MAQDVFVPSSSQTYVPGQVSGPDFDSLVGTSQTERGLRSSLLGADANEAAYDAIKAYKGGDTKTARARGLRAQELLQRAEESAPRVQSVGQINGAGDVGDYLAGMLGGAGPGLVKPVLGGLAGSAAGMVLGGPMAAARGGAAGGVAAMYPDMRNAAVQEKLQAINGAEPSPDQASEMLRQGGNQAVAESLPFLFAPTVSLPSKLIGGRALIPAAKTTLGGIGREAALQGAVGVASTKVGQMVKDGYDPNRDTSQDNMQLLDSGVSNAVLGAPFGAVGHAGERFHGAVGDAGGLAATGAKAAGKVALKATGAAGEAIKGAWDNRPESLSDAAVKLGGAAADAHNAVEDAVTRFTQRGKDADVDTLLKPADTSTKESWSQSNAAKHDAASNMVSKISADPESYPDYVRQAAERYTQSAKGHDSWKPLADSVNDWKRSKDINDAIQNFASETGIKVGTKLGELQNNAEQAMSDARDAYEVGRSRQNAQSVKTTDDMLGHAGFDALMSKSMLPHLGLRIPQNQERVGAAVASALKGWISGGFAASNGEITAPRSLLRMLQVDPVGAVTKAADMMHRQGLIDDKTYALHDKAVKAVSDQIAVTKQVASLVKDRLLPTMEAQMSPADRRDLIDHIASGKIKDAELRQFFGPRSTDVAEDLQNMGLTKKPREAEQGTQKVSAEELGAMTNEINPNTVREDTEHHFYKPAGEDGAGTPYRVGGKSARKDGGFTEHNAHAEQKIAELQAKNNSVVRRQGYMDYIRERAGDDKGAAARHFDAFTKEHSNDILSLPGKGSVEEKINKNYFVLREEKQGASGEPGNIQAHEFSSIGRDSKWGEASGGEYGTSRHGRVWLERKNADGKLTQFATSTTKIIRNMAERRSAEGTADSHHGLAGQEALLHQGLASLMTSEALTGRIGLKDTANGPIRWLKEGDNLPDHMPAYGKGKKLSDVRAAVVERRNADTVARAQEKVAGLVSRAEGMAKDSSGRVELEKQAKDLRDAIKNKDYSYLDKFIRKEDLDKDAFLREKDDVNEVGASGDETKRELVTTTIARDPNGGLFGSKKQAKLYAKEGDRIVKKDGQWVIERERAVETRVAGDTPQENMEGITGPRSIFEDRGADDTPRTHNDYAAGNDELHPAKEVEKTAAELRSAWAREDAAKAQAKLDAQRKTDEGLGKMQTEQSAQTKAKNEAAAAKQSQFILTKLRAGEGEFMKAFTEMTHEQRIGAAGRLATMLKAGKDDALWDGKPPLDMKAFAARTERVLAKVEKFLSETDDKGRPIVTPKKESAPAESRTSLQDETAKRLDYLKNPPADYSAERVTQISEWAKKQAERVRAELAKLEDSERYDKLDDLRFKLDQLGKEADKALATERDMAEADKRNGTKLFDDGSRQNAQSAQDPKNKAFGTDPKVPASDAERVKFFTDINRRLGPSIKAVLEENLYGKTRNGSKIEISGEWTQGLIKASVYARDLGQIGAHESFHEFFNRLKDQPQAAKVMEILSKAADSTYVTRQLERKLDGEMNALAQIKKGAPNYLEERMAYMFQFHQAGVLKVGPETMTVFQKIAATFRKITGLLSNDQKADQILRAFDKGHMQDADAAAKYLAKNIEARENLYKSVNKALEPALTKLSRVVNTAETNLRAQGKGYDDVRRMFKRSVGESGKQGYLDAKDHQMKQWSNKVAQAYDGLEAKDLELAAKYLHSGEQPTDPKVMRLRALLQGGKVDGKRVEGILPSLHNYLVEAGVKRWEPAPDGKGGEWVPMGKIKDNYFPRVLDTATMVTKPEEFAADLLKHNAAELNNIAQSYNATASKSNAEFTPKTAEDVAKSLTGRMINGFGQADIEENTSAVGYSPFMQAVNQRQLHWLHPEVLKKWGEKDVAKVMNSYVAQAVKRAEYVRRFGNGGEILKGKLETAYNNNLGKMVAEAFGRPNIMDVAKNGAFGDVSIKGGRIKAEGSGMSMGERLKAAALSGLHGDEREAAEKKFNALENKALKVAQNAATDVMAMEGTLGNDIGPKMRRFQNTALVYSNMRVLSTSLFSQFIDPLGLMVRGGTAGDAWNSYKRGIKEVVASIKGEHIKDLDSMIADQVGTTDAGGMLAAYGQLYSSQYMGSTFRKANDALFKYNGMEGFNRGMQVSATRTAVNFIKRHADPKTANERSTRYLAELNLKAKDVKVDPKTGELDYTDPKIQEAIHQWVNGAIMRPNSAQRPAWGSDPHYMMFWHMKQFAYTFHDVILKRAQYEAKEFGDMGPAGVLAMGYTPMMIAADAMKSVLLTGSEPVWMKAGLASELEHGAMRAGLMGKFQPLADVALTPGRSMLGLGGPLIEQIAQLKDQTPSEAVMNALPGANLLNMWGGKHAVEVQGED